jgi:hypothetical protein
VWIEPPLGPPWERHPCFDRCESSGKLAPFIAPDLASQLGQKEGLITGVVQSSEVSKDRRQTILEIEIGADQPLSLLIRGGADVLLGHLVIIDPPKRQLFWASEANICFSIVAVLAGPEDLTAKGAPLRLPISAGELQKVRDEIRHGTLSKRQHQILRKFRKEGLGGTWKLSELLLAIPLIRGRDKDRAVHRAAVMLIEQAEKHGDCSGAVALVQALPGAKGQRLTKWLWEHSPIRVDLKRRRRKAYIFKTPSGEHRPFLTAQSRSTPI